MPNIIHILDRNDNVIRLIKRYHITLLNLFPKVLEDIIKEYIDDIIEVNIIQDKYNKYNINIKDQNINYIPISLTFCVSPYYKKLIIINCHNISNNVISNFDIPIDNYCNMWHVVSNTYLKQIYGMNKFYDESDSLCAVYNNNIITYDNYNIFKIINHKLFKNILIIMNILVAYIQKKLIS